MNQSVIIFLIATLVFSYPFVFPRRAIFCPAHRYLSKIEFTFWFEALFEKVRNKLMDYQSHGMHHVHIHMKSHSLQLNIPIHCSIAETKNQLWMCFNIDREIRNRKLYLQTRAFWRQDCSHRFLPMRAYSSFDCEVLKCIPLVVLSF